MSKPWYAVYRSFDDDTLIALANAGLLRRAVKDVDAGKVGWLETPAHGALNGCVKADGQHVALDGDGPQKAHCDCSAHGICKHILAAVLWLRNLPEISAQENLVVGASDVDDTLTRSEQDVNAEVLALDAATLFKRAGRPAVRRAVEFMRQFEQVDVQIQGQALLISLPEVEHPIRYVLGTGFDGMVSEIDGGVRIALHLTALLVVWRQNGKDIVWPDYVQGDMETSPDALGIAEIAFIDQVRKMLFLLYESGLSHLSDITASQLRALNMSARAEDLPRLASMLRNLAGTVDLLSKRDVHTSERQAIQMMAQLLALCTALESAQGPVLIALRGKLRRDFQTDQTMNLLPLGASWWETRGGARGLTLYLWSHEAGRVLQVVLARPDGSDPGFDRGGAWSRHSIWPGAGTTEKICQGSVSLENPRLSDDGRIGLGGETRATATALWPLDDLRWNNLGYDNWAELARVLQRNQGLTAERMDCVVLRPKSIRPPELNEVSQILEWILFDGDGNVLSLQTPCETQNTKRLDNLERLVARQADVRAVVARVERNARGQRLEPVALLVAENKQLRVVSLDFANEQANQKTTLAGRILRLLEAKRVNPPAITQSQLARLLGSVLEALERQIMTGRENLNQHDRTALSQAEATMRAIGLDSIAALVEAFLAHSNADNGLRLVYASLLCLDLDTSLIRMA